jgi:hypothetical protein
LPHKGFLRKSEWLVSFSALFAFLLAKHKVGSSTLLTRSILKALEKSRPFLLRGSSRRVLALSSGFHFARSLSSL